MIQIVLVASALIFIVSSLFVNNVYRVGACLIGAWICLGMVPYSIGAEYISYIVLFVGLVGNLITVLFSFMLGAGEKSGSKIELGLSAVSSMCIVVIAMAIYLATKDSAKLSLAIGNITDSIDRALVQLSEHYAIPLVLASILVLLGLIGTCLIIKRTP